MPGEPSRRRRWMRRRAKVRALLARLRRAGACQVCGEPDPLVLDFHHVDPATKAFTVGGSRRRSVSAVAAEVAKCCLICANCHRRINAGTIDASGLVPLALPDAALVAAP
jgi:5-methylcytosine-specific restriction endonuclease McrA